MRGDIVSALGVQELGVTCGAVCVYPSRVPDAVAALKKIGAAHIPVAAGENGDAWGLGCEEEEDVGGMGTVHFDDKIWQLSDI